MHIAESVSNRILNIADGVTARQAPPKPMPAIPDPSVAGAAIDAAVRAPAAAAAMPEGGEAAILSAALGGAAPVDGLVSQALLNEEGPTTG